jgi:HPt (histidine-containing phosphotransfer) domain-containing protein
LRDAASRDDRQIIGRAAHSLAGAGRNVSADALAARASVLEDNAGALSTAQLAAEIAAMRVDLDATLDQLRITA